ncbi:MAG TPA: phosphoribosylanthranilate isomerase [Bauldia sp.]|nr:phosphoribosylanthranilate isomerase [Bauldia sp.]
MNLTVKICGLSTEETLDAALAAGADMVGFVFFPRSPRFVSTAVATRLADRARGRAEIAALAVDLDDAELSAIVDAVAPDWFQLHGRESAERVADIRRRFKRRTMKAIGVATESDLGAAEDFAAVADMLLIDAKPPKDATRPGGNGAPFDWSVLRGFAPGVPYLLSGGLTPGNVAEAIHVTGATGVDVSSGVETTPGRKDPALIRAFIANARAAARQPQKAAS